MNRRGTFYAIALAPLSITQAKPIMLPVIPPPPDYIADSIYNAAFIHRVDPEWMVRIAWCESRYNPDARSPSGLYHGLYQYTWSTWDTMSSYAGYSGYPSSPSPYNLDDAARVTAWALSHGYASHWPNCRWA